MTKAELIDAVADAASVSKADAERTIGAFFDHVVSRREEGRQGRVAGLRLVQHHQARARTGRNPQTGAPGEDRGVDRDEVHGQLHAQGRTQPGKK